MFWRRLRFEMRRVVWNVRRILHLGAQYLIVTWKMATNGRIGLASRLSARVWTPETGWSEKRVLGVRCVTDAFCNLLTDYLQGGGSAIGTIGLFKWHGVGTGTTAEDTTDDDVETPTGEARVEGTQAEGSGANIYQSVATYTCTVSAGLAITEHVLANNATPSSFDMIMDRTVFAAINVALGNKIEFTYELQIVAGG